MTLFSLVCHYRVSSNDNEETLRTCFENMHKRLDKDVRTSIGRAKKELLEASELKVDMKWKTQERKYTTNFHTTIVLLHTCLPLAPARFLDFL